jgi:hypothetical protein
MDKYLEISFIYSKDAVKIKNFIGLIPNSIECINYMDVYNKLSKNDYMQSEPSDAVVSSYLMKQLQSAICKSTTKTLFYVLGGLHKEVITDIKEYVESLTSKEIVYKIYYTHEVNLNGTGYLFDEAIEFETDL